MIPTSLKTAVRCAGSKGTYMRVAYACPPSPGGRVRAPRARSATRSGHSGTFCPPRPIWRGVRSRPATGCPWRLCFWVSPGNRSSMGSSTGNFTRGLLNRLYAWETGKRCVTAEALLSNCMTLTVTLAKNTMSHWTTRKWSHGPRPFLQRHEQNRSIGPQNDEPKSSLTPEIWRNRAGSSTSMRLLDREITFSLTSWCSTPVMVSLAAPTRFAIS